MLALIHTVMHTPAPACRRSDEKVARKLGGSSMTQNLPSVAVKANPDAAAAQMPQASDVLTRGELLAMMPRRERRAMETGAACLPAMAPYSRLDDARPADTLAPACGVGSEVGRQPVEKPVVAPRFTSQPEKSLTSDQQQWPAISTGDLVDSGTGDEGDFTRRVLEAARELASLGQKVGPEVSLIMRELEELAQRIAKTEEMRAQASASPPDKDSAAAKWHEVALVTLGWSHQELLGKQRAALLRLAELADNARGSGGKAVPPKSFCPASLPIVPQQPTLEIPAERSMKKDLEALRLHDPECVLIVRKIKKLGWESPALLRRHMEGFGEVSKIFVSHSTMKPNPKRPGGRARPAALGFVVMADKEGKAAALKFGMEHDVMGIKIEVAGFDPFADAALDGAAE